MTISYYNEETHSDRALEAAYVTFSREHNIECIQLHIDTSTATHILPVRCIKSITE